MVSRGLPCRSCGHGGRETEVWEAVGKKHPNLSLPPALPVPPVGTRLEASRELLILLGSASWDPEGCRTDGEHAFVA